MRIVIDATAAMSGGGVYLRHLLPALARLARGHEFIVFHKGDFDGVALPGFTFKRIGALAASNRAWLGKAFLKLGWRLFVFPYDIHRLAPDVLFSNAGFAPLWWPARTKLVSAQHNSMPLRAELIRQERSTLRRWRLWLLRRLMERSFRQSAATIVFSQDTRQRAHASFQALPRDPNVIYHGIEWGAAERAQPPDLAAWQTLGVQPPYLLYVSQFHRYKNLLNVLAAFRRVAQVHPALTLVLAGARADRAYWREVEGYIVQQQLDKRVIHLPECPREQLPQLYRRALAFIHASLAEACPFPLLEALVLGVPIAAARMSSLPEIAGEAALYFDPYDAAELAAVLERLVADEALRGELRRKAVERAQMFSWEAAARQTLAVLEAAGRGE